MCIADELMNCIQIVISNRALTNASERVCCPRVASYSVEATRKTDL